MFNITARFGHVAVLLYLMWVAYRHVQAEISVDIEPSDATVHEGDNVTFVCDLRNVQSYVIYWAHSVSGSTTYTSLTRDRDVFTGTQQAHQSVRNRLAIVGDEDKEEFSLRIQNVQGSDSGEYSCRYMYTTESGNPGGHQTTACKAALTVLVPPNLQSPMCSVDRREGSVETGSVGDQVNLVCSTTGGSPRPNITLTKENKIITEAYQATSITHMYMLNGEDNGVIFTCTMTTPALDAPRSCSVIPLMILPSVTISPVLSTVEEGDNILLECNAEGVPSIYSFSWKVFKTNSRETLASNKYSLSNDGHTLSMQVIENIVLYCIASVPSGLSNNSTVRIEVTPREETITEQMNTRIPQQPSLPSLITTIIVVLSVLVVILIIIILLFQWQRRKKRKSKIPIDPKVGYKMSEMNDEYDETGRLKGTKSKDETIYNDDQDTGNILIDNFLYATAGNPGKQDGRELKGKPLGTAPASTPHGTLDSPHNMSAIYAQPNKKPKLPKQHTDENEITYSTVADEGESTERDPGLLYADLALNKHGPDTENNTQPKEIHSNEQTVYAMIRT